MLSCNFLCKKQESSVIDTFVKIKKIKWQFALLHYLDVIRNADVILE
jgi:hypothetical protein